MAGAVDDEEGGFAWDEDDADVVFLDDDDDEAGASAGFPAADPDADGRGGRRGEAVWLAEERIESGRDLERSLPPHAPRSRVLASLLALAVFLGCAGAAFTAAYHRHVTDRRIADTLNLTASASPPMIPGLAALGFQQLWHSEVEERVVVPVLNHSPGAVVLLGAVLEEPGMIAAAALKPLGATRLGPGEQGDVTGDVTVDCTQDPAAVFPYIDSGGNATVPLPNTAALLVSARTEGGIVGEAALDPDADGPDLQVRICEQEGFNITGAPSISAVADPRTHSVEVSLSVASSADVTLGYRASAAFTRDREFDGIAGLSDTSALKPTLPTDGVVRSGGTMRVSFTVQVLSCPIQVLQDDEVYVEVTLTARGNPVDAIEEAVGLATPLTAACGKG